MGFAVSADGGAGDATSDAPEVVAANVLRREFNATRPNQKWAGDITYVPTRQGWLYVAVLMDLYSRRVVGWAMDAGDHDLDAERL